MASSIDRAKRIVKEWLGKMVVLVIGLVPASCHYQITGPALWAHQSSYAFEAWLVMWCVSILIACGAIYVCAAD